MFIQTSSNFSYTLLFYNVLVFMTRKCSINNEHVLKYFSNVSQGDSCFFFLQLRKEFFAKYSIKYMYICSSCVSVFISVHTCMYMRVHACVCAHVHTCMACTSLLLSSRAAEAVEVPKDAAPLWRPRIIRPSFLYCSIGIQNRSRTPWTTIRAVQIRSSN